MSAAITAFEEAANKKRKRVETPEEEKAAGCETADFPVGPVIIEAAQPLEPQVVRIEATQPPLTSEIELSNGTPTEQGRGVAQSLNSGTFQATSSKGTLVA